MLRCYILTHTQRAVLVLTALFYGVGNVGIKTVGVKYIHLIVKLQRLFTVNDSFSISRSSFIVHLWFRPPAESC